MSIKGAHVRIIAAVLLATTAGFIIARVFDPHGAEPLHAVEEEHAEEAEHVEGFVALSAADAPGAGVELVAIERGGGVDLLLPGRVAPVTGATSVVAAPLDGTIVQLLVATGSRVSRGTPVASIRSPEGGAIRAQVDAANAALVAAEALDARNKGLFEQGAISRQEWEATHAATLTAQANVRAAQSQAAAMGSPDLSGVAVIRSPIAGVVTRIAVTPGAVLDDGMEIVTVSDQARMELVFDAPPASTPQIARGQKIAVQWTGGQPIEAEVEGIAPSANGAWASVRARVSSGMPPMGTVVSGRLIGGGADASSGDGAMTVPSDAVQRINGVTSVFVAVDGGFRATAVAVGRTSNSRTEIVAGLSGDERIAGMGAFLLKAELGKGEAEHDH